MTLRVELSMRLWLVLLAGCAQVGWLPAATPGATLPALGTERPPLTVVLAADVPDAPRVRDALRAELGKGFDLRFGELPADADDPPPDPEAELRLLAARKEYVEASFAPCVARLAAATLVPDLLARGRRLEAARVLLWRAACRVGAGKLGEARADAAALAAFGLEVPPDAAAVSPEVELLFTQAEAAADKTPRAPLAIEAPGIARARVAVDGRAEVCIAPCTVDVRHGDHLVRVEADGHAPDARLIRVPSATASFTLVPAPPELAARQWATRYGRGPAIDSAPSVGLLATATRSRSLAVFTVESGKGRRLRGVLALDGEVAARSERSIDAAPNAAADEAPALLRDLLVRGKLLEPAPSLWQRPVFWVVVAGATVVAAGVTALILYQPPVQTGVHF